MTDKNIEQVVFALLNPEDHHDDCEFVIDARRNGAGEWECHPDCAVTNTPPSGPGGGETTKDTVCGHESTDGSHCARRRDGHHHDAPITRADVERVVEEYCDEVDGNGTSDSASEICLAMTRGAREVLRRLSNPPDAPESSTESKRPILDLHGLKGAVQRPRQPPPCPKCGAPTSRGHVLCDACPDPISQRPRRPEPVPQVPALKVEPAAPEVVWSGDFLKVDAQGTVYDNGRVNSDSHTIRTLARALAEALRKLKRAEIWCGCGCGNRVLDVDDPRAYHCRVAERRKAAESMRERAKEAVEKRAAYIAPEDPLHRLARRIIRDLAALPLEPAAAGPEATP